MAAAAALAVARKGAAIAYRSDESDATALALIHLSTDVASQYAPNHSGLYFEPLSGNDDLVLTYNAVPEPDTGLLVLLGFASIVLTRQLRKFNHSTNHVAARAI